MLTIFRSLGFLVVGSVLTSAAFTCGGPGSNGEDPQASGGDSPAARVFLPSPAFARVDGGQSIADIAEKRVESVVNISSEKVVKMRGQQRGFGPFFNDPFFRHFFGPGFGSPQQMPRERREKSLGSGVIVSEDGVILTNNHVVEKADKIHVTLADGREFKAKVIGTDPETDVGVLKLEGDDVKNLTTIPFGNSEKLRLGDVVLAIGNPFGVGQTVTMGIVSAKGRANVGIVDYEDFIQTDAAINPGNSGGALVDMEGNLVGINTAIITRSGGYQGIGFAIPSNMAKSIMDSLVNHGKVIRGWLGVAIQDVDQNLADALGLSTTKGVLIGDVTEDSPADKGGIKRGDVILRIDGEEVDSTGKLRNLIAVAGAKAEVKLEILRDGKKKTLEVTLGEKESSEEEAEIDEDEGALGGLTLGSLSADARKKFQIPDRLKNGVVVTDVARGSPAARAGFRPGDVIRELNRKSVKSVSEFTKNYKKAKGSIAILIQRGSHTLFLALRKD